ncbi:OmpH family outer membrane protein [Aurantibacillus circumpalustris]|uniref:OmpH family outer membrane protein n=1 Tax=Aurantibacillus circumpalustris TaxID=3036359 RepID=UPI00295AA419|nr:OmpH family outer membrane protein [Aurantibacillus circumpalustris]
MNPKFNIDRPKVRDEEIKQNQNFEQLVERFKQQSLKKAKGDESWWRDKKIRYTTVITGITVVCTITYLSLFNNQATKTKTNETLTTQNTLPKKNKVVKSVFINAPTQKLKTPYSTYKVNNAKGGNIAHTTSSKIKVPKNSFVDKNGKDIIGDVTIEYKEFHDMGDVIANGIPMAYDSAGTKYNLETAGMFDIKGFQNGEPVFIKSDKNLEVELASSTSEQRFNQYYLDTLKRNWQYIQKDHASNTINKATLPKRSESVLENSPKLVSLKNEIEKVIPKKIDSVKVIYTAKVNRLPKAKEPNKPVKSSPGRPTFNLDGNQDDFPELAVFNNVLFEVGSENKNYSKELHDITWSDVKVSQGPVKGKNYILTLSYRNRTEKLVVYPVLSGTDFEKAEKQYEQKLENYQALLEKRSAEEKRLMQEMATKQAAYLAEQKKKQEEYDKEKAALREKYNLTQQNELASNFNAMSLNVKATRLFRISQFGIFNSDCPHAVPNGNSIVPIFAINEKEKFLTPDFIYLIDHSNKTVFALDQSSGFKLNYDPEKTYSICIFSKNKLFLCNKEAFKHSLREGSNRFLVNELSEKADNLADFKKAIEI